MRKYFVPLLLFSAIGAQIVVYVKMQDDDDPRDTDSGRERTEKTATKPKEQPKTLIESGGRNTPTKLSRNRWLSELERVLARDDLRHAHHYRAKLCEHMDAVLEDDVLVRNLIAAIQKYAVEERDPEKRKLLLPILRVLTTPEATQIIEAEYYRTSDESERLILLDAMANPKHNPDTAGVWAAEMAVNSPDSEHRQAAFLFIRNLRPDQNPVVVRTAKQIYAASTRPGQRISAINEIARRAEESDTGRQFIRERLQNPRESELEHLLGFIEGWATPKDASLLETLATQFPAMSESLRERAEMIRTMRRIKDDPEAAKGIVAEREREVRERDKKRAEEEKE